MAVGMTELLYNLPEKDPNRARIMKGYLSVSYTHLTLALRGLHDRAMNASNNMSDRKEMLQEALMAQRQMLVDAIGKRAEDIPQEMCIRDRTKVLVGIYAQCRVYIYPPC